MTGLLKCTMEKCIFFLFKLSPDTSPVSCISSEHLKGMTGRHKAQEGSLGCNGPQVAFAAAESINLQCREKTAQIAQEDQVRRRSFLEY